MDKAEEKKTEEKKIPPHRLPGMAPHESGKTQAELQGDLTSEQEAKELENLSRKEFTIGGQTVPCIHTIGALYFEHWLIDRRFGAKAAQKSGKVGEYLAKVIKGTDDPLPAYVLQYLGYLLYGIDIQDGPGIFDLDENPPTDEFIIKYINEQVEKLEALGFLQRGMAGLMAMRQLFDEAKRRPFPQSGTEKKKKKEKPKESRQDSSSV